MINARLSDVWRTNFQVRSDIGVFRELRDPISGSIPPPPRWQIFNFSKIRSKFHVSRENLPLFSSNLCRSASAGWLEKRKKKERGKRLAFIFVRKWISTDSSFRRRKKRKKEKETTWLLHRDGFSRTPWKFDVTHGHTYVHVPIKQWLNSVRPAV